MGAKTPEATTPDATTPKVTRSRESGVYDVPEAFSDLGDIPSRELVEDPESEAEAGQRRHSATRDVDLELEAVAEERAGEKAEAEGIKVSRLATEIYTVSYLILFAIWGTLARLGLTALTHYPGTPIIFNTIWSNFAGSLVMGFLAEDRMLFRYEWGVPKYHEAIERAKQKNRGGGDDSVLVDLAAARKAHLAAKKTIPLYIGLATGFCGSFTTFSSFIRDVFLAISNDLEVPGLGSPATRNGGYSFMAMLAVIIATISISLSGLFVGAHLAVALEGVTPSVRFPFARKFLDPFAVFLGWGCWLGAVLLTALPPNHAWRGEATFALVFAPLGCLLRFYLSAHLNGRMAAFPLGTFAANVLGTSVLGMAWDLAHVPEGGVVSCQVFQGIEDGFCGCLTTISTWVSELSTLRRRSAWLYGATSVVVSLVIMIAIMGGLRWSDGYGVLKCTT